MEAPQVMVNQHIWQQALLPDSCKQSACLKLVSQLQKHSADVLCGHLRNVYMMLKPVFTC